MTTTLIRPRRSALYMPGSSTRALEKARGLAADVIIMDLEDAVAPSAKEAARAAACAALAAGGYGRRETVLRVNGLDTAWGAADIAAAATSGADAVLFPKVGSAGQLAAAVARLDAAGGANLPVWAMIETPAGVLAVDAIASLAPRLEVLVMGTADLARALRLPPDPARLGLLPALGRCLLAARARGLDILDGIFTDLGDEPGFRAACRQGKALGLDGKTLIHPAQLAIANETFGVSAAEAAAARKTMAAWQAADAASRGIAVLDGRMIERLHAGEASRLLALHEACAGPAPDIDENKA
ncbi:MAG: CoA ester lyase [Gammaproteobacteria bacterium]|nr:CoA ester lyase [Gammaproteobacteria bacterium]